MSRRKRTKELVALQEWGPIPGRSGWTDSDSSDVPAQYTNSHPYVANGIDPDSDDSHENTYIGDFYEDRSDDFDNVSDWDESWETALDFKWDSDHVAYRELVKRVMTTYKLDEKTGLRKIAGELKLPIDEIADILVRNLYRPPLQELWSRKVGLNEVLNAFEFARDFEQRIPPARGDWDWSSLGGKLLHGIYDSRFGISGVEYLVFRVEQGSTGRYTRV